MDPNLNRMSMGSRAGTSVKPKFGAPTGPAPSRQGTAARVSLFLTQGLNPIGVGGTVDVKDRPLTTGGGINGPQGGGSQRKVYDRNYYVTKTKEKMMVFETLFRVCRNRVQS